MERILGWTGEATRLWQLGRGIQVPQWTETTAPGPEGPETCQGKEEGLGQNPDAQQAGGQSAMEEGNEEGGISTGGTWEEDGQDTVHENEPPGPW